MIKVLIADDIEILRTGLKAVLSQDEEIKVVGEAVNGREAYELSVKLKPDVVLMDMRMPDFDGSYGTRQIKEKISGVKVLVLTTFDDKETVRKAVSGGADGYI
ncbi:MAG: response regulator transcription factor, partial [Ruminococcus sp.]|nr:response regulator transcription factor [Ruminococcus sp.]